MEEDRPHTGQHKHTHTSPNSIRTHNPTFRVVKSVYELERVAKDTGNEIRIYRLQNYASNDSIYWKNKYIFHNLFML